MHTIVIEGKNFDYDFEIGDKVMIIDHENKTLDDIVYEIMSIDDNNAIIQDKYSKRKGESRISCFRYELKLASKQDKIKHIAQKCYGI